MAACSRVQRRLQVGSAFGHPLLEQGVGVLQELLVMHLVGNVAVDPDHAQRPAVTVILFDAARLDVADCAAGQIDAVRARPAIRRTPEVTAVGIGQGEIVGVNARTPEVVGDLAARVPAGTAYERTGAVVPLQAAVGKIPVPDADAGGLGGELQALQCGVDTGFAALVFGDIAERDPAVGGAAVRRGVIVARRQDVQHGAVFAQQLHLIIGEIAGCGVLRPARLQGGVGGRSQQDTGRPADQFCGRIAQRTRQGLVALTDDVVVRTARQVHIG